MHTIEPDVTRPDCDVVTSFEEIPSSIVSDVTGNVGLAMDSGLNPIGREANLVGTALTVKAEPGDNLIIHKAITMPEPGDVLVIDGHSYLETAYMGELMCESCKANNLAGIVLDRAIRDSDDIAEMDLPVYAHGIHPQGPLKQSPGSINVTISCGGVSVEPGDILVGDSDGVTVVPADSAEEILEETHEKLASEDTLRERVRDGEYLYDIGGYEKILDNINVVGPEDSLQ